MLQYFDFIGWIDSKILNKPFSEVIKNSYLERQLKDE